MIKFCSQYKVILSAQCVGSLWWSNALIFSSTLSWQSSFCALHVSSSCPCPNSTSLISGDRQERFIYFNDFKSQIYPKPRKKKKKKDETTGKGGKLVPCLSHRSVKRGRSGFQDETGERCFDLLLLQELNCSRKFSLSPTWNLTFCQQLESRWRDD